MIALAYALAEKHNGRWRLTLDEVAEQLGFQPGTIRNKINRGEITFFYKDGESQQLFADVRDVAEHLDKCRSKATLTAKELP